MTMSNPTSGKLQRFLDWMKDWLAIFALAVISVMFVEIGCRVLLRLNSGSEEQVEAAGRDSRALQPTYANAAYDVDVLLKEDRELNPSVYRPYTVWSRKTFAGQAINIDGAGIRKTHHGSTAPEALQLWMFGGSTMWGQGAPDEETIPSYMAKALNQDRGLEVNVLNLGEIGFVSTQENVALIRRLQTGERPDFVIFLDGVNDGPAAALWPDVIGAHMDYYRIRDRFENPGRESANRLRALIASSGVVRLTGKLQQKWGVNPKRYQAFWDAPDNDDEIRQRGEAAADLWIRNYRITAALGQAYGFMPIYVLQPSLMVGAKPLHPAEEKLQVTEMKNEAKRAGMDVYREMVEAVRNRLENPDPGIRIHDATDLFEQIDDPIYIDYVHMAGSGNRIIAHTLTNILSDYFCGELPSRVSTRVREQLAAVCD
jgi:hypothetical protein